MSVPGIGPIISSAIVAAIGKGDAFTKGGDFAAWLGLVLRGRPLFGRFRGQRTSARDADRVLSTRSRLEPISKLLAAVDTLYRSNDSAHGRTVGTHSGSFSGGAHCRWSSWTQTNPDAARV